MPSTATKFQEAPGFTRKAGIAAIPFAEHPHKQELIELANAKNDDIEACVEKLLDSELDLTSIDVMFRTLGRAGKWEKALSIFQAINRPNLECYRGMLAVLAGDMLDMDTDSSAYAARAQEALKLHDQMLYIGLIPDSECCAFVMTALRKSQDFDGVERVFHWLQARRQTVTRDCYNAYLLSLTSRLPRAKTVFQRCEASNELSAVAFYALLLSSLSDFQYAIDTWNRLIHSSYCSTPLLPKCFLAVLRACEVARTEKSAREAFKLTLRLPTLDLKKAPDLISPAAIDCLLTMCATTPVVADQMNNAELARYFLEEAGKRNMAPQLHWYENALKACTKIEDRERSAEFVMELFQQAEEKGLEPSIAMYGTLISVLDDWTLVGQLLQKVVEFEDNRKPNAEFVDLILEKLTNGHQLRKAQKFYLLSLDKGFIKGHWLSHQPPVLALHYGNLAMSFCAIQAGFTELHELYLTVQTTARKEAVRPRRLKHPLLLLCRLDNISEIQLRLASKMAISTTVHLKPPPESDLIVPTGCALLRVEVPELTFWHLRGALGI